MGWDSGPTPLLFGGIVLKPFAAVDSEGFVDGNGDHRMYLIGSSEADPLISKRPLLGTEILDWICSLDPDYVHLGYFFGYDVTQIIKALYYEYPLHRRESFLKTMLTYIRKSADAEVKGLPAVYISHPTKYRVLYRLVIIDGKIFSVQRRSPAGNSSQIEIQDCSSFFQTSFIRALDTWGISYPPELVEGKKNRSLHTIEYWLANHRTVVEYNQIELGLLVELMNKFASTVAENNLIPTRWIGPGSIAGVLLKRWGVAKPSQVEFEEPLTHARDSFFGGWFEISTAGAIEGPIHEYDINSAYPTVLAQLPEIRVLRTLEHGTIRDVLEDGVIPVAVTGEFTIRSSIPFPFLPCRTSKGEIVSPYSVVGTMPGPLVRFGLEHDLFSTVSIGRVTLMEDGPPAFPEITELYQLRKLLGSDLKGMPIKLALNSLYGKFAQSVGTPRFANPVYASLITSLTRLKLIEAMGDMGDSVLMVATDAVYSLDPLSHIDVSDQLGGWSHNVFDRMLIVQPGIHFAEKNGELSKSRSRGLAHAAFADSTYDNIKSMLLREKGLSVSRDVLWGWRITFAQGTEKAFSKFGNFTPERQTTKVGGGKRTWNSVGRGIWRGTSPAGPIESIPYGGMIGLQPILDNLFDAQVADVDHWGLNG